MARNCGIYGCGMRDGLFNPFFGGGEEEGWTPADFDDNLVLWLESSKLSTLLKENGSTGTPVTNVTTDGDTVGSIYDLGYHGLFMRAEADVRRPLLGSDSEQNSYLSFDGSDDYIKVLNSQQYFRNFHNATPVFSIFTLVRMGASTDSSTRVLIGSNSGTGVNAGVYITRTSTNKIQVFISSGSGTICNHTTTASLTVSSGWTPIFIELNGPGTGKGRIIIGSTTETFNVTAGATANALADLYIGSLNNNTAYFKGDIARVVILNRVLTADDITNLRAYNPSKSTNRFSVLQWDIDFDAETRIFSDVAGTTQITNGGSIRNIQHNQTSIFGPLNRLLTSASAGVSPVWNDSDLNGKATGSWDGVDDNLDFGVSITQERAGKWTEFVVFKNDDSDVGSNFLKGTSGYQVVTGTNYTSNEDENNGNPYFLLHTSQGGGIPPPNSLKNGGEGWNVICYRRDGSTWTSWSGLKVKKEGTDSGIHEILDMGEQFNPNFWTDGKWARLIKYTGNLSDSQVEAKIDELMALYNI